MTERMKALREEAEAKAKANGHELGEWKWDGRDSWYAWCQLRNCYAFAWLNSIESSQPYGGNAL